jgi:transposase
MNDFALAVITALACVMYAGYTYQTYRDRYKRRKQAKIDAKANADDLLRYAMTTVIWVRNEMSNVSVSGDDAWDLREHLQFTLTELHENLEDYSKTLDNESHN